VVGGGEVARGAATTIGPAGPNRDRAQYRPRVGDASRDLGQVARTFAAHSITAQAEDLNQGRWYLRSYCVLRKPIERARYEEHETSVYRSRSSSSPRLTGTNRSAPFPSRPRRGFRGSRANRIY